MVAPTLYIRKCIYVHVLLTLNMTSIRFWPDGDCGLYSSVWSLANKKPFLHSLMITSFAHFTPWKYLSLLLHFSPFSSLTSTPHPQHSFNVIYLSSFWLHGRLFRIITKDLFFPKKIYVIPPTSCGKNNYCLTLIRAKIIIKSLPYMLSKLLIRWQVKSYIYFMWICYIYR